MRRWPLGLAFALSIAAAWAWRVWWSEPPSNPFTDLEASQRSVSAPAAGLDVPPPRAASPAAPPVPWEPSDPQLVDAPVEDDNRSVAARFRLEEIPLQTVSDRIPRTPDRVAAALEAVRPQLEACLLQAQPQGASTSPVVVELVLGPVGGGDRSTLKVAAQPDGFEASSVPCLTQVLRTLPFEMDPTSEALSFRAFVD